MSKTGRCLCGKVSYELAEAPTSYGACHCGMCRKFSGGIELGVQVTADQIKWSGEDSIQTSTSSEWAERGFCKICGSSLFWRLTIPGPNHGLMSVFAGSMDDLDGMELSHEVYIDAKPAGHAFAGERQRMTEADVMARVANMDQGG